MLLLIVHFDHVRTPANSLLLTNSPLAYFTLLCEKRLPALYCTATLVSSICSPCIVCLCHTEGLISALLLLLLHSIRVQERTWCATAAPKFAKFPTHTTLKQCLTNSASCQSVLIEFAPIGTAVIWVSKSVATLFSDTTHHFSKRFCFPYPGTVRQTDRSM